MNAEALIGSIPSGWTQRKFLDRSNLLMMIYEHGKIKTQQDPRIGDLPPGWRKMFGTFENPLEAEMKRSGHFGGSRIRKRVNELA